MTRDNPPIFALDSVDLPKAIEQVGQQQLNPTIQVLHNAIKQGYASLANTMLTFTICSWTILTYLQRE
jgi:hypothetical protein